MNDDFSIDMDNAPFYKEKKPVIIQKSREKLRGDKMSGVKMQEKRMKRIDYLDSWRAIGCLLVFTSHILDSFFNCGSFFSKCCCSMHYVLVHRGTAE